MPEREHKRSPGERGYRMPAEWEPHAGTWLSWPHNRDTWPETLAEVEQAFRAMVAALAGREPVHVNVLDAAHERHVAKRLEGLGGAIHLHRIPTDDAWCRDHGPIGLVAEAAPPLALDCRFNAWGGKYPPYDRDDAAARAMAAALGIEVHSEPLVLEGGAIEVNGRGALLTTEQCLLNPNRNPGMSRASIEARLRELLGVHEILWLGEGIAGDDTDGHVDDLTRFVGPAKVVTAVESDVADENHRALAANRERLQALRLASGAGLEILELPMPAPRVAGGQRLPASYANFYIANGVVLVPAFDDPMDTDAQGLLAHCFPDRRILPIDSRALVQGLGAVHCLTQQIPASGQSRSP